jgi:hypothetical protein
MVGSEHLRRVQRAQLMDAHKDKGADFMSALLQFAPAGVSPVGVVWCALRSWPGSCLAGKVSVRQTCSCAPDCHSCCLCLQYNACNQRPVLVLCPPPAGRIPGHLHPGGIIICP